MVAQWRFRSDCAVWSESSLSAFLMTKHSKRLLAIDEKFVRQNGCAGWSEPSLGGHVRGYAFLTLMLIRVLVFTYIIGSIQLRLNVIQEHSFRLLLSGFLEKYLFKYCLFAEISLLSSCCRDCIRITGEGERFKTRPNWPKLDSLTCNSVFSGS